MFIHVGNRKIVSDKDIVGIFNIETLRLSDENLNFLSSISSNDKTVVIDRENKIILSEVSPFTVIRRTMLEDVVWRR